MSSLNLFLPANRAFSLDVRFWKTKSYSRIPRYMILLIQVQLAMVYFFAGLAKLNTDWMVNFMPMAVWLPAKGDLPLIGPILAKPITARSGCYRGTLRQF